MLSSRLDGSGLGLGLSMTSPGILESVYEQSVKYCTVPQCFDVYGGLLCHRADDVVFEHG